MLLSYGMSLQGRSHKADDLPCQDSYINLRMDRGWVVSVVSDGVGSAKYSEWAAKLAVNEVALYFAYVKEKDLVWDNLGALLKDAFQRAVDKINKWAEEKGYDITDCDTTLTAAVYDGKRIAYGHSGDGGIIGLAMDGRYVAITKPQKGEDFTSVIPLRDSDKWEFGFVEGEFSSVLVATDGVYDAFFPYLLKTRECEIYVPLVRYFMDLEYMLSMKSMGNVAFCDENIVIYGKAFAKSRQEFLESKSFESVQDDMTVAVVVNTGVKSLVQNPGYYAEPDWEGLKEAWNRKAYPHLYVDESVCEESGDIEEGGIGTA